ncbi:protein GrpE [Leuconostoc litchii]|uniref:Protein GrpE n=1 Tax=Leuconostoc litchii TaxID=1981069 RepID=A0A6P2CQX4_9LACO|nr:nucleotide exchange factor GrpE [Leuconostoc litchii]TYC46737.1 nucleotide exchange factor GrpE [Leuconostoc litchii]GMA70618.1 protein GrpE [Leuconostoc litchii]
MTEKNEEIVEDKDISEEVDEKLTEEIESEADNLQADSDLEQEKNNALVEQVNNLEEKLLRSQAEIQNIQQRNAREMQNIRKYDGQKLASAVLPAVDNLERALQVEANDEVAKQIKTGVEMTLKTLTQALIDNGITSTGEVGEAFDPTKHQAIQSVDSTDVDSDQIAQVLQKGYVLQDRVIRPAMVAVAK